MPSSQSALRRASLRSFVLVAVALLLAPEARTQGSSASESGFVMVQSGVGSGGRSESVLMNSAASSVSQVGSGREWTSANYIVRDGVVWSGSNLGSTSPIVTGVRASGLKEGGESVRIFGFNFANSGAGLPDVEFGNGFGTGAFATANTMIDVVSPSGVDNFGNPLGESALTVTTGNGVYTNAEGFLYEPALVQGTPAQPGRVLELQVHTKPGSFPLLAFGKSIPAFGINVNPFDGQLVVPLNFQILSASLSSTPNGFAVESIALPGDSGLVGGSLEFQVLSLDNLTLQNGAWSNKITVPIVP